MTGIKILIWGITSLIAAGWTGLVWVTHHLLGWLLGNLSTGGLERANTALTTQPPLPLPVWLQPWVDTAWFVELQAWSASLLEWLRTVLSFGDVLMSWIGPLLWIVWALVLVALLLIAVLLHVLLNRSMGLRQAVSPVVGLVRK